MTVDGLAGTGVLQSHSEWQERNRVLAQCMSDLVNGHARHDRGRGIDVGCQAGALTDAMQAATAFDWTGVDPKIVEATRSEQGLELLPGTADSLPFADGSFDVALFANVYEHVLPDRREPSLVEIARVLAPGGVIVGQIPNPYFPIESHSRLPFMGWLPMRAQKLYWRLAPVPWEHDFYVVTIKQLTRTAQQLGLEVLLARNFNYPPEVIPTMLRAWAQRLERPMRLMPWAWQFVLARPDR